MGSARPKPNRLAEKITQIRNTFGISQSQMLRLMGAEDSIPLKRISDYELGNREPPLDILLRYARAANVPMEVLADDELDLPDRLPGIAKHNEIRRQYASRRKSKR